MSLTPVILPECVDADIDKFAEATGTFVILVDPEKPFDKFVSRVNRLTKGAVKRAVECDDFEAKGSGDAVAINYPVGMEAKQLLVVKLSKNANPNEARKAGAKISTRWPGDSRVLTVVTGARKNADHVLAGLMLRSYAFLQHKSDADAINKSIIAMTKEPELLAEQVAVHAAMVEGVFFTRDLTNEPANILTTSEFADRLLGMKSLGLQVEVIEKEEMEKLGMHAFLAVGYGSPTPTKMVIMRWNGGGSEAPFALVGKGVVFDTGGISIKPAGGMETMTMDMGGAGVVSGVMRALALRKAKANVVGVVGLVENMPDGYAQRPGDVVTSMKGDTIEVINTDAEGRLVLADVLWYVQKHLKPCGIVDLATLTGAMVMALGHENAGAFSNDNNFVKALLQAAGKEDEGAWHMPLGKGYAGQLKSRVADVKNVGGRPAGACTAAEFLRRFVKDDMPWIHLDIAGVASQGKPTTYAPAGASGWGVRALDRLIRDNYEA